MSETGISIERVERFFCHATPAERTEFNKVTCHAVPMHVVTWSYSDAIKFAPIPHLWDERQRHVLAIVERVEARIAAQPDRYTETDVMRAFGLVDDKDNPQ